MRTLAATLGLAVMLAACSDSVSTTETTSPPVPAPTTAAPATTSTTQGPVFTPEQQSLALGALDKVLGAEELTNDEASFVCIIALMPPGPLSLWGSEIGLDDRWTEDEKLTQLDLAVTRLDELGLCG